MLNISAIRCSLAFAPYLNENLRSFLRDQTGSSRVVKQGGMGLVMRCDHQVNLRFQGRDAELNIEDARHYHATIEFRSEFFDVMRLSDEIILASVGRSLMLSHPQSEIWLEADTISHLVEAARESRVELGGEAGGLPQWLNISSGDGRLLMSDQRSGRWVLMGEDHLAELNRLASQLKDATEYRRPKPPPVITVKGLSIHLQSAFRLAETLEEFASTGRFEPYEDVGPTFHLHVVKATEGLGLLDVELRVGLNAREARKWSEILRAELESLNAFEIERGNIRTTSADTDQGRWILQRGDEVFITKNCLDSISSAEITEGVEQTDSLVMKKADDFVLILSPANGNCVALDTNEASSLLRVQEKHSSK